LNESQKKIVGEAPTSNGQTEKSSFCIVDAQSVKNTDTAENRGYDAGKKVSGIKRHIAVNMQGLPHAIYITTASITDRQGAITMALNSKENLSSVKTMLVDSDYTGNPFSTAIKDALGATVEVEKLHKFVVIPKRWVVERSVAWLEKCHRLWKNCERKQI
jgi:transposase